MCALLNRVLLETVSVALFAAFAAPYPSAVAQHVEHKSLGESARDLSIGTWVLNRAKSNYRPGPVPLSVVRTYERHPDGVKVTIETITESGKQVAEYIAEYDSTEYPVRGSSDVDALSLKAVDAYTAEIMLKHGGREIGFARRVISDDGKTMTMTVSLGSEIRNVAVYDKKEP